jgi:hypothetical protein
MLIYRAPACDIQHFHVPKKIRLCFFMDNVRHNFLSLIVYSYTGGVLARLFRHINTQNWLVLEPWIPLFK